MQRVYGKFYVLPTIKGAEKQEKTLLLAHAGSGCGNVFVEYFAIEKAAGSVADTEQLTTVCLAYGRCELAINA